MKFKINDVALYFQYNSPLILTLFFISFLALIINYITKGKSNYLFFENHKSSLIDPLTYLRFFSHIIGHSDWEHFINNYIIILLIGPMIEEKYGTLDLFLMIIITSLIVGLINFFIFKYRIRGSSDLVFMMIILASFANIEMGKIPITFILIFIFYVIREILNLKKDDGVFHVGHIIGAVCGTVFGFLYINAITISGLIINLF